MFKIILLCLISLNLSAGVRIVPKPSIVERGDMECFDISQGLFIIVKSLQAGSKPEAMVSIIIENGDNAKKNSKLPSSSRKELFDRIDEVVKQSLQLVKFGKEIGDTATPSQAQTWYYDFCTAQFKQALVEYKAAHPEITVDE